MSEKSPFTENVHENPVARLEHLIELKRQELERALERKDEALADRIAIEVKNMLIELRMVNPTIAISESDKEIMDKANELTKRRALKK